MRRYYKAYYLKDLRQFSEWVETPVENEPELTDNTICYIGDNLVVVLSPILEKEALFKQVTPAWEEFCRTTLHFELPAGFQTADVQDESSPQAAAV